MIFKKLVSVFKCYVYKKIPLPEAQLLLDYNASRCIYGNLKDYEGKNKLTIKVDDDNNTNNHNDKNGIKNGKNDKQDNDINKKCEKVSLLINKCHNAYNMKKYRFFGIYILINLQNHSK